MLPRSCWDPPSAPTAAAGPRRGRARRPSAAAPRRSPCHDSPRAETIASKAGVGSLGAKRGEVP